MHKPIHTTIAMSFSLCCGTHTQFQLGGISCDARSVTLGIERTNLKLRVEESRIS
uniref:Uncharacterized protein n=1 Tax=Rhizophora mucronata TaxID=61149 RepID=A0A2P2J0R0_RHIMU